MLSQIIIIFLPKDKIDQYFCSAFLKDLFPKKGGWVLTMHLSGDKHQNERKKINCLIKPNKDDWMLEKCIKTFIFIRWKS